MAQRRGQPWYTPGVTPLSLYLHIPFCRHRCAYCDFNTYAQLEHLIPAYVRALCAEAHQVGETAGRRIPVHSVFFGGGTPSLLPAADVEKVLTALASAFELLSGAEITLEANPGTLTLAALRQLRAAGINRLSLGVQSAHADELRLLERQHDFSMVIQAVKWAQQAGFDRLNLDWIFGLPYQTLELWRESLKWGIRLRPEHLSLYALSVEHGTPMQRWIERGLLPDPDADLAADMYDAASEMLDAAGYLQYEISNWARAEKAGPGVRAETPATACRHNLQYWRNLPYLGFGAGAHGFAAGMRYANVLGPAAYIQRVGEGQPGAYPLGPAVAQAHTITRAEEIGDTMMMGLRLTIEGVSEADFRARFGHSLQDQFAAPIARLQADGLLEWAGGRLRLTPRGRLLGNRVFREFI